jgi:hypothetical protein
MDTLLKFLNLVKSVEYLIAIGFILAFLIFWRLLRRGHRDTGRESANKEIEQ